MLEILHDGMGKLMITPMEAIQIITDRKLSLRPTRDGMWIVETASGTRLHKDPQSSPIAAIELADQSIKASEQRQSSPGNDRLMEILNSGKFYVKTRQENNRTVFDAFLSDDSLIVSGKLTFSQAAISAENIINETSNQQAKRGQHEV